MNRPMERVASLPGHPCRTVTARSLVVAACALIALALAACTSLPGARSADADPDASWVLLAPLDRATGTLAAESVQVLAETRLRVRGVRRLARVPQRLDGAPVAVSNGAAAASATSTASAESLERALADGHRYAVSLAVDEWESGRRPGDRTVVALDVTVHDLVEERVLLRERVRRTGRAGAGIAATAERAVAAAFDGLSLAGTGRDDDAPAAIPAAPAAPADVVPTLMANGSRAPVGLGLRAPGGASRDDGTVAATPLVDAATVDALEGRATAFFYGPRPPIAALAQFDRVVLEPDNVRSDELARLGAGGAATFAYLSIGEVGPDRAWASDIDAAWALGRNETWNSTVMDLADPGWTAFLDARVDDLVEAGYDGLFLDTMDSYRLYATSDEERARQERALGDVVRRMKERHPSLRLIANRGFEVLDVVGPHLEAIAAESLYARWNNEAGRYVPVPAADRDWLLGQLDTARTRHGLDVIAIDYLPPERRDEARAVAGRIASHGYVPWVATPSLDHVGVGAIDVQPREVLMLFDSRVNDELDEAEVHRLVATPLEYFGYVPVYHDLATSGLPDANLAGRFAGIVHWSRESRTVPGLQGWFERQAAAGVPVALFGTPWLTPDSALARRFGLSAGVSLDADTARVRTSDALIGFEASMPRRLDNLGPQLRSVAAGNTVHLGLEDGAGRTADPVVTGPWGGVAFHPGVIEIGLDNITRWVVDPFAFLARALELPDVPMPDVTSEDGQRLWMAHIDGDALPSWAELPGRRLGAEIIRDRIIERYRQPHTISIVESEMTSFPAFDDRRKRMFDVARELFAMEHVEIASHTFSHPLRWRDLAGYDGPNGRYNLPVADYRYSAEREVAGSIDFIDRELAPSGKRTRVMLWSGDALPNEADLAVADRLGIENVNGGFTTINRAQPWLNLVTPMARTVGERLQVYAPVMNENVYTNDWHGPFDGYRRAIETFEMTERPRRLKPLSIYYHFYAGTKVAAVRSLEEVYDWSLAQDVRPIALSDYARRVRTFREAGLARRLDGTWRLHGMAGLRSVRVLGDGWRLDESRSVGVRRSHVLHDGLYLATDGSDVVRIGLRADPGAWRRGLAIEPRGPAAAEPRR